jgi:hypothetical protein
MVVLSPDPSFEARWCLFGFAFTGEDLPPRVHVVDQVLRNVQLGHKGSGKESVFGGVVGWM